MKDITECIKQAISTEVLWGLEEFYFFLNRVKETSFKISYWDGEENWATISVNGEAIGYVWRKYPLIFLVTEMVEKLTELTDEFNYVILIRVSSLTSRELVVHSELYLIDRLGCINYEVAVSASDIWFDTIN